MSGHPGKVLDFKKDIILLLLNVPLLDILHIYSHTRMRAHTFLPGTLFQKDVFMKLCGAQPKSRFTVSGETFSFIYLMIKASRKD